MKKKRLNSAQPTLKIKSVKEAGKTQPKKFEINGKIREYVPVIIGWFNGLPITYLERIK